LVINSQVPHESSEPLYQRS